MARFGIGLILTSAAVVAVAAVVALYGGIWFTGRPAASPLPLAPGGPAILPDERIWIDTDAACGAGPRIDPDDCIAIVWLVSRGADIVGISTSFGNAGGDVVVKTVRKLGAAMALQGLASPPVFTGHSAPVLADETANPAGVLAIQAALQHGPLTILALGPLTNVTAALQGRPDLQSHVTRLVAVMGHQPGHVFHPTEGRGNGATLGHGPIFSDLNLSVDPGAAQAILAMDLPITLIPYDAATKIMITAADLDVLAAYGPAMAEVSQTARSWLTFWQDDVGLAGFYPFDWVAAAYLVHPQMFGCAASTARVAREWTFWLVPHQSLLVGEKGQSGAAVTYCPQTAVLLHDVLLTQP